MTLADEPPIHGRMLYERCLQDAGFVEELLQVFKDQSARHLAGLRRAISDGDGDAIWHFAHAMKGSAANLSALRVEALAGQLEAVAKQGAKAEINALTDAISAELDRCYAYGPELLAKLKQN